MDISDQELRALVRDAIARRGGQQPVPPPAIETVRSHGSHGLLTLVGGGDPEGRCLIEPAVPCTHCGYCQSLGH
jgi:hypothetical protein